MASGVALIAAIAAAQQAVPSIDHIFIQVEDPTSGATELAAAGFRVMPDTSVHTGQGTASRAMLLDNGYLELIWVTDAEELQKADATMAQRMLSETRHSRFGLGLFVRDPDQLPFATRPYWADWMPPGSEIRFATTESHEPAVFLVPDFMTWAEVTRGGPPITTVLPHANGANRLTRVEFVLMDGQAPSPPFDYLESRNIVALRSGDSLVVRIELDDGRSGQIADFRPTLPLIVRY